MAFDAGFLSAAITEIKAQALGGRVEKVYQPRSDEVVLLMRSREGSRRLMLRCGSADPRVALTSNATENPATPPMLCMLLRKHLTGGMLVSVEQPSFERVAIFGFATRDELGFECKKYIVCEVMGKNSNLMFCDGDMKIVAAMRTVDFTTSRLRQVLPGMKYELPPAQEGRVDPLCETREAFSARLAAAREGGDMSAAKFISSSYLGIAPVVARELAYRATGAIDTPLCASDPFCLTETFFGWQSALLENKYAPTLIRDGRRPVEYSYTELTHYPAETREAFDDIGSMLDRFYGERDREAIIKARAADLLRVLNTAEARIARKLEAQRAELDECKRGEEYRLDADLIMANIYLLKKGDARVELTDYSAEDGRGGYRTRVIVLDSRLAPAANAQRLYKKYNKSKNAERELTKQIELGRREAEYIASVLDALRRSETGADLAEIRAELMQSGYLRRQRTAPPPRSQRNSYAVYETSGGYRVLCGRNNIQNDELTFHRAERHDIWLHVKGAPGSHCIMVTNGEEPPARDYTEACEIAAENSSLAGGEQIPVDYTEVRNIKKPAGGAPGFVVFHTNYTAYVTPDREKVEKLRVRE